jgi:DNA ligase-1
MTEEGYADRFRFISSVFGTNEAPKYNSIQPTEHHEVIATDEKLNEMMLDFISRGNEGLMLRLLDTPYENKRTWQLCKYKFFKEEEYELFDVLEDSRGGFTSMVVLKTEPYVDRDGKPKDTFSAGIKDMTQEECAELLANKDEFIGQMVTIQFQEYTDYGVPLFPKFKGVRMDAE